MSNYSILCRYMHFRVHEIEENFPKTKEEKFILDFIKYTKSWNAGWINDMVYPRRPQVFFQ